MKNIISELWNQELLPIKMPFTSPMEELFVIKLHPTLAKSEKGESFDFVDFYNKNKDEDPLIR
jgi:hypothetical protein